MMVTAKTTITATAAVAFVFAMSASMMFFAAYAESSISIAQSTGDGSNSITVTQSTEEGLEVECEGNLKCEIVGDGTVVTSSEDDNTSTVTSTTILNQSDMILSENDLDAIDEQDLSSRIMSMVNRLLDNIFA
jgi:TRAP-type C4-dicarboxylate transport system substrate-binding protein